MKKFFILFLLPILLFGQRNAGEIKLGHYSPSATSEGGFIIGYEGSRFVDKNLAIGWSLDWFHKNYVDRDLVREFDQYFGVAGSNVNEIRAETTIHSIPAMLTLKGFFPFAPRAKAYVTGGIGAEMLLINYNNFTNPNKDDIKAAFDFNWRLGVGALFKIGKRSDVFGEIIYHNSEPSWTYEVRDQRTGVKRTFERVFDMSGVITRVGVRFYW